MPKISEISQKSAPAGALPWALGLAAAIPMILSAFVFWRIWASGFSLSPGEFAGMIGLGIGVWILLVGAILVILRAVRLGGPSAAPGAEAQPPLGLPAGSVRAALTILVVVAYIGLVVFTMATGTPAPTEISVIVTTIIGFYFGTRAGGKTVGQEFDAPVSRSEFEAMRGK